MGRIAWKVGELARQTGISVRTLHHYDELGLLKPSRRTEAGYRLYTECDVGRLQRIVSLRSLGFSLEEIRHCLDSPDFSPRRVVNLHISALRERIEVQRRLCDRLEAIAMRLSSMEKVPVEEFVRTIEEIKMAERLERYYTPEQLEELDARRRELGAEGMRRAEQEWAELIENVRTEMQKGTDPSDERVQGYARRWMELVRSFTGGNPGIEKALNQMWHQETTIQSLDTAEMRRMMEYIMQANAASKQRP
ncbi:MAG: MerR family transcriptional regulator [Chloroflexota bacterium]|nr:MerR family transcriptional regulator [Chloroflexota bacterium]